MASGEPITILGVDGTRDGWVAVIALAGKFASLHHYPNITELSNSHPGATAIAIDIPLWLPIGREPRVSDLAARKLLGERRSSLFPVPPWDVLAAPTFAEANRLSKDRYGRGISQQSYALGPRILDAVNFIEASGDNRLCEVHPELSFQFLAKKLGSEITASKKTWRGFVERLSFLQSVDLAPPLETPDALARTAPDDVLDACVAAWTAHRIATGVAELVGVDPDSTHEKQLNGHPPVIYA